MRLTITDSFVKDKIVQVFVAAVEGLDGLAFAETANAEEL